MKLENLTFRGGVHPEGNKELSSGSDIVRMDAPAQVVITLSQHTGAPAKALVTKGEHVKIGQKIAESGGFISAPVHASIAGTVAEIRSIRNAMGTKTEAIVIKRDEVQELGYEPVDRSHEALTPEEIIAYINEAGIVGMGGAGFPTYVKMNPPADTPVDTVIINGAECEPYLTCDDLLMRSEPEKIVEGLKLEMKALGASKGFIAIEDNKPKAIAAIESVIEGESDIALAVLKTKYPQGDEKQIIYAVTNKRVGAGKLPASVGVVVSNVGTAAAIVDAVYYGKPLYERIVTITGRAVNTPKNVIVPFGTMVRDVVEFAGGYKEAPGKIIFGGPMMGLAQYTDEAVTDKRNNGILVMTQAEARSERVEPCIRCGRCVDSCPMQLEPNYLASASSAENFEVAESYYITQCVECGVCSYVCPSKRPLTEMIRFGKRTVMAKNRK